MQLFIFIIALYYIYFKILFLKFIKMYSVLKIKSHTSKCTKNIFLKIDYVISV